MKKKTKIRHIEFIILGALMMIGGFIAMLTPVIQANRLGATDPRFLTGFITVVTGAMLLSRSGIAVFFYFLYVISFLIFQIRHHGVLSLGTLLMLVMLGLGFVLIKVLKRRF